MKNVENSDGKSIFENGYQIRGIILSRDEMMCVSKAYHIGLLQEYIQENYPGYQMDEYFRLARDVFAMQEKEMEEEEAIQYVLKQSYTQEPAVFRIYQLRHEDDMWRQAAFMNFEYIQKKGLSLSEKHYEEVYCGKYQGEELDSIYYAFNSDLRPADFKGHSLSVSDVIVIEAKGTRTAFYVDSIGFSEFEGFFAENRKLCAYDKD